MATLIRSFSVEQRVAAEEVFCKNNSDVQVIRAGFLVKQNTSNNKHSCRWAVLTSDGLLTYYKKSPKKHRGRVIDLKDYTNCERVIFYDKSKHIFTLFSTKKKSARSYLFYASHEPESERWIDAITPFLSHPAGTKQRGSADSSGSIGAAQTTTQESLEVSESPRETFNFAAVAEELSEASTPTD